MGCEEAEWRKRTDPSNLDGEWKMAQTPMSVVYTNPHVKDILRSVPSTLKPLQLVRQAGRTPKSCFMTRLGAAIRSPK